MELNILCSVDISFLGEEIPTTYSLTYSGFQTVVCRHLGSVPGK